jgi:hypothetical protein
MSFYIPSNHQKRIVAHTLEECLPPLCKVRQYHGLCILDLTSHDDCFGLPPSLQAGESIYFDNILFLLIGEEIPDQLLKDMSMHFTKK